MSEPMTFFEWCESTGGVAAGFSLAGSDPEATEAVLRLSSDANAPDVRRAVNAVFAAYHAYLCAYIAALPHDE